MKGLKKLSILGFGLALTATLAACSTSNTVTNELDAQSVTFSEEYPDVTYNEEYASEDIRLANVVLNTDNAKTTFYLGDEFSTEGLIVYARYFKYENNKRVATIDEEISNYSIDSSEVNMYVAGTYTVTVSYREGAIPKTKTYNVTVKNNNYEDYPNITYLSGMDIKWTTAMQEDETFCAATDTTLTVYVDTTAGATDALKAKITTASFDAVAYATTNDATGAGTVSTITAWNKTAFNPTVDCSTLDVSTPGTYMVKLTLSRAATIDGESVTIPVSGFVLINVRDVISSVKYAGYYDDNNNLVENGVKDFKSSIDALDYSDLAFNVGYYSGTKLIRVSDDPDLFNFTLNQISPYKIGKSACTVKLTEADLSLVYPTTSFNVNVVDSGKSFSAYNIVGESDFTGVTEYDEGQGKLVDRSISTEEAISEDGRVVANYVTGHNAAANYDGISFSYRVKITKTTGYIKVSTTGKGRIRVYGDYSGTTESNIAIKNSDGTNKYEPDKATGNNGSGISYACTLEFDSDDVFTITAVNGTCYIYGIIVEYEA